MENGEKIQGNHKASGVRGLGGMIIGLNCYVASKNPEFGTTLARHLNRSRTSAVLQSNLIAIKFGN